MQINPGIQRSNHQIVVGVADMKVSNNPAEHLITYALGSCLGITIYDPCVKVGGLLHIMLPDSSINLHKKDLNPFMFADSGIPLFFKETYRLGAQKARMVVKFAGCSQIADESGIFNIGKKNYSAARELLEKNNITVTAEHCGSVISRTMILNIDTGAVTLKIGKQEILL
jgi:chemotaxis protein CheD